MSRVRARGKWGKGWRMTKLAVRLRRGDGGPRVRLQWGRVAVELTLDRARRVADLIHDCVDEAEEPPKPRPESPETKQNHPSGTGAHPRNLNAAEGQKTHGMA